MNVSRGQNLTEPMVTVKVRDLMMESSSARLAAVCVYDVKVSRGLNIHTVRLRSLSGWWGGTKRTTGKR